MEFVKQYVFKKMLVGLNVYDRPHNLEIEDGCTDHFYMSEAAEIEGNVCLPLAL